MAENRSAKSLKGFSALSPTRPLFDRSSISQADRVIILKLDLDETEPSIFKLLDASVDELFPQLIENGAELSYSLPHSENSNQYLRKLKKIAQCRWNDMVVIQLENGTILVEQDGVRISPARPMLRNIARNIGVDILNGSGNAKNTRTLGSDIIKMLG